MILLHRNKSNSYYLIISEYELHEHNSTQGSESQIYLFRGFCEASKEVKKLV